MKPFISLLFAVLMNTSYLFAMDPPGRTFVDPNHINETELAAKLITLKSENLEAWFKHHASPLYVYLAEQEKKEEMWFILKVADVVFAYKKKNKKKPIDKPMFEALRAYYEKFVEKEGGVTELVEDCLPDMKLIDPTFVSSMPRTKKSKKKKLDESTKLLINDGQSQTSASERFAQAIIVLCQTYLNEINQLDSIKNNKIAK